MPPSCLETASLLCACVYYFSATGMCGPQVSDLEGAEGKKSDVEKSCQLRLYSPAAFYLSVHVTVRGKLNPSMVKDRRIILLEKPCQIKLFISTFLALLRGNDD